MYSLPTSTTLAAFTIASAASTEPIRPRVSTIPSASDAIGGAHCNRIAEYYSTLPGTRSCAYLLLRVHDQGAPGRLRTHSTSGDTHRHADGDAHAVRCRDRHA